MREGTTILQVNQEWRRGTGGGGGVSNPETGGEWGKEGLAGGSTNMEGT